MIYYAATYIFSEPIYDQGYAALIKKNRPDNLAGKLCAIGGKVEPGESYREAAIRELKEESGYVITDQNFPKTPIAEIFGDDYVCVFYSLVIPNIFSLKSVTDEEIIIRTVDQFVLGRLEIPEVIYDQFIFEAIVDQKNKYLLIDRKTEK